MDFKQSIRGIMNPMGTIPSRKGQTALEYMLMIAIVLVLLVLVMTMTTYVEQIGTGLGGRVDNTRAQVIDWILT